MSKNYTNTESSDLQVSIINDAAWVGFEIAKGLEEFGVRVSYLPRGRSFYGKTLKVFVNAIKSRGIKHVNYALQDAFALRTIGKTIHVLHCHGTELFGLLDDRFKKESKDVSKWGWMVRGNIKAAKKVIVSTPDLLPLAQKIRDDVEYIHNPIDTQRFSPRDYENKKLRAVGFNLWYENVPNNLVYEMRKRGIEVNIFNKRPFSYQEINEVLKTYDIFIDRFTVSSLSKTCLESMSCGLATIDYRHRDDPNGRIQELLDENVRRREGRENRQTIIDTHDRTKVVKRLIEIYRDVSN